MKLGLNFIDSGLNFIDSGLNFIDSGLQLQQHEFRSKLARIEA